MQKIIKWFAPSVTLGVAIFIVYFLISINSTQEYKTSQKLSFFESVVNEKPTDIWLNHFAKTQKLGYYYPVNEVYIKVDLNEKITKTITYELSATLLDPYQLFCLKDELKKQKLRYYLKKNKAKVELVIYSNNKKKLDSLVVALKNYQIAAKIKLKT